MPGCGEVPDYLVPTSLITFSPIKKSQPAASKQEDPITTRRRLEKKTKCRRAVVASFARSALGERTTRFFVANCELFSVEQSSLPGRFYVE